MDQQLEYFIDQLKVNSDMTPVDWFIDKYKLNTKNRKDEIVALRQYISLLIFKNKKDITATAIGKKLNQDHSTVLHSLKIARQMIDIKDPTLIMVLEKYKHDLNLINWKL
jgi:chromosomal replication initiation ATPase DnaA